MKVWYNKKFENNNFYNGFCEKSKRFTTIMGLHFQTLI